MKICLIGHFSGHPDEGVKNLAFNLYKELSKSHEVMKIDIRKILKYWKDFKKFDPEIIHFIVGPSTVLSFVISKVLSLYCKNAKVIMSAPQLGYLHFKKLISILKPDLMLIQSWESEKLFTDLGCKTRFLPNGVDIEKFIPVQREAKYRLREKYGIEQDKFVILHVGHIRKNRGILSLKKLVENDNQVLIVGSTATSIEKEVYQNLKESGCLIIVNRFKNIEEIYALSDCYIFPTIDKFSCIETPMSILEAMSCNLPVITTKFGALPRIFEEGEGLIFVEKEEDFFEVIGKIKNNDMGIKTRGKIFPYSWENIARRLEGIYNELLR
jgi:glycosyltransferase involved in cell wall biosynthesis